MKYPILIKLLFFPYFIFAISSNNTNDWRKDYSSIEAKIADRSINAIFISTGGYSGGCVALDIINNTPKEQKILLEAGDKLICENEEMQNIFITQTQYIVLAPNAKKRNTIFGFCCASTKSAPSNQVHFIYTDNNTENELKLAKFLNSHPSIDLHAVQHAVWVICNNAEIDGIYADENSGVEELKKIVSEITGKKIPWYTKKYDVDSLGRLQETSSKLVAIMDFNLNKESIITVQICNDNDEILKVPLKEKSLQRGFYDYKFTWETNKLPKGKYFARVFSDGQMIQEREIYL